MAVVRRIYDEFVRQHRSIRSIARHLNQEGIPFVDGRRWTTGNITLVLRRAAYAGRLVWGRTSAFLSGPLRRNPQKDWVIRDNAFEPIIGAELFENAQRRFRTLTLNLSDDTLLQELKTLLETKGRLSTEIIKASGECASLSTYQKRLGGLLNVYRRLGCQKPEISDLLTSRQHGMPIRNDLLAQFTRTFPEELEIARCGPRRTFKAIIRHRKTGLLISLVVARCHPTQRGIPRWKIQHYSLIERKMVTILARLDLTNTTVTSIKVLPPLSGKEIWVREDSPFLNRGVPVYRLTELVSAIETVLADQANLLC